MGRAVIEDDGSVGVPAVELTVAAKVTDCPKSDGLRSDVTVVAVAARADPLFTITETAAPFDTTTSGRPSRFISAIATEVVPTFNISAGSKLPSPLPSSTAAPLLEFADDDVRPTVAVQVGGGNRRSQARARIV